MYVHKNGAGGLFSCEYQGDLELHRYPLDTVSAPTRRYRANAGSHVSSSSRGRGQSIRNRRRGTMGTPASSPTITSLGRYRGLGKIGRRKRGDNPSSRTRCSSNMKNLLSPVARPRLMTNKSPNRRVAGDTAGVAVPEDSFASSRVHLRSLRNVDVGMILVLAGSVREPPNVNSTEQSGGGGEFLNQTTAEDTNAFANCTSAGSNRWSRKSVTAFNK